jgi:hypothetical protein
MTMKRINWIGCAAAVVVSVVACSVPSTARSGGQADGGLRVGIFDSRGVALAYGRSDRPDCMMARVNEIRQQHALAEAAGDEDRMEALETEVKTLQDVIHLQVFSGEPIDDILTLIEDDMEDIAAAAGVDLIVGNVLYQRRGVQLVDVTLDMCAAFEPDAGTSRAINELLVQEPVDPADMAHDH